MEYEEKHTVFWTYALPFQNGFPKFKLLRYYAKCTGINTLILVNVCSVNEMSFKAFNSAFTGTIPVFAEPAVVGNTQGEVSRDLFQKQRSYVQAQKLGTTITDTGHLM